MHEHPDVINLMPPGTYIEDLAHPSGQENETIELAIFKEHRFAFYFWNRWTRRLNSGGSPPSLLTIDWHRDLATPSESELKSLEKLDLSDEEIVAQYVWSKLDTHNDSHLLSACHLNLLNDVILLKNYGRTERETYIDRAGDSHTILECADYQTFEKEVLNHKNDHYILDIDLDYFVKEKVFSHQLEDVTTYRQEEIRKIIDNQSPLFEYLFPRLLGITIATEPRYCGGILKSNRLLEGVLSELLTDQLQWKHLV